VEGRVVTYGAADHSAATEWQTGVRLYYPLYSIGGRSASVQRTEAMVSEAEGTYRELDQAIAAQLDEALARLIEARGQVDALGAAVGQWEEVVDRGLAPGRRRDADRLSAERTRQRPAALTGERQHWWPWCARP
jgi:hypothetical protein